MRRGGMGWKTASCRALLLCLPRHHLWVLAFFQQQRSPVSITAPNKHGPNKNDAWLLYVTVFMHLTSP